MINKIDATRANYQSFTNAYNSKNNSDRQLSFKSNLPVRSPVAKGMLVGTELVGLLSIFSAGLNFPETAKIAAWVCGGAGVLTVITELCHRIFAKESSNSYCGFGPDARG